MTLTCTACERAHSPHEIQTVCRKCGQPLSADYFFSPEQFSMDDLEDQPSLWRYGSFLPSIPPDRRISLGEGHTPLMRLEVGGRDIYLKDETANPTGSFKDRGMCIALSMARVLGIKRVALPSAGNAGVAAAAYAQAGGLECRVYLPTTIPEAFVQEIRDSGAEAVLAGKTITEAGAAMSRELDSDWFNLSTFHEPYRVEGKKTLGLEIAEQLDWDFPDVVVYPTGGGTGLIGIWKAFQELRSLNWVRKPLPRMVAVQMEGCGPVVKALHEGQAATEPWPDPHTRALGLNVPAPLAGSWMLSVLRASRGTALAVPEEEINAAQDQLVAISGLPVGPEAAVAWRGVERLMDQGWIMDHERVVVVITGDDRRYG
ncbi:MAG: threonine synthase [Candidatus Marinimicrobia bacterium]|nr:threonine synthase [Candidatus Neomarinimicrobiota bacterium]